MISAVSSYENTPSLCYTSTLVRLRIRDAEVRPICNHYTGFKGFKMSTRANVVITDGQTTLYFYRHRDGYPSVTGDSLTEFVKGYSSGKYRFDAMQSAGWLVLHGNVEYVKENESVPIAYRSTWKVGAYEPTDQIHGDVEYIYTINLSTGVLSCNRPDEFSPISFGNPS